MMGRVGKKGEKGKLFRRGFAETKTVEILPGGLEEVTSGSNNTVSILRYCIPK